MSEPKKGEKWNIQPKGAIYSHLAVVEEINETEVVVRPCRSTPVGSERYKHGEVRFISKALHQGGEAVGEE